MYNPASQDPVATTLLQAGFDSLDFNALATLSAPLASPRYNIFDGEKLTK